MQEKSKSISTSAMKGYLAEGKLMLRAIVPQGLFLWSPFSSQPNLSPAIKPTLGVQSIPTSPSPYFSRPLKAPCTQKMHTDVIHPMTQVTASCTHGHPFNFCLSSTLDSNCWLVPAAQARGIVRWGRNREQRKQGELKQKNC